MNTLRFKIILGLALMFFYNLAFAQLVVDFSSSQRSGCGSLQSFFFNNSTFNGAPISCGDFSYEWSFGATICEPTRIFNDPGFYEICLTVSTSNGNSVTECKEDYIQVFALPTVQIDSDQIEGCSPLTVNFTDISSSADGNIVSRLWDVGGSNAVSENSTVQSIYSLPGTYTVKLIVSDDNGCQSVGTFDDYIMVREVPVAGFTVDDAYNCSAPFTANFSNTSTGNGNIQYEWNFQNSGNIQTFQGENPPPILWTTLGQFDVQLIATNLTTGCADTLLQEDFIGVGNSLNFNVNSRDVCVGENVEFTQLASGNPESFFWDFGTGNPADTSVLANPVFSYDTPGCYYVTVSTINEGCLNEYTSPLCIEVNPSPTGDLIINNQRGCELPHSVSFEGTSNNAIQVWDWSIDEGGDITRGTGDVGAFTFNSFGNHIVTVVGTDQNGCEAILMDTVFIQEITADIRGGQVLSCVPLNINLSDNSSSVVPITDWQWIIGDSIYDGAPDLSFYTGENPFVSLSNEADTGIYDVMLIVTNELGCMDTILDRNKISIGLEPIVQFEANPRESCIEDGILFTDLSSNYGDQWFWDFGDGGTSFEHNPEYMYQDTGYFTVCLTVFHNGCQRTECYEDYMYITEPRAGIEIEQNCVDPYTIAVVDNSIGADSLFYSFYKDSLFVSGMNGDTIVYDSIPIVYDTIYSIRDLNYTYPDTGIYKVYQWVKSDSTNCEHSTIGTVYITDPVALFEFDTLRGCAPLELTPTDLSDFAVRWQWSATDPSITFSDDTLQNPVITFTEPGRYTDITLTITDVNNCSDTFLYTDTIYVNAATPLFSLFPSTGCSPLPVIFTDESTSLYGEVDSWLWDFGDDSTSIVQNPVHEYLVPDTFSVSLTITDTWNCEATLVLRDTITPTFPFAAFDYDTLACTGQDIVLTNRTIGVGNTYLWEFGDGQIITTSDPASMGHSYTEEGFYTICLTATDINGCVDSICHEVRIANPIANFEFKPSYAACPPLIDTFTNLSINADPNGFIWEFGDGDRTDIADPIHIYTQPGVYSVALIATSYSGCMDTLSLDSIIFIDGPRGSFDFEPKLGCDPHTVTFITESIQPAYHFLDYDNGIVDSSRVLTTRDTFVFDYERADHYLPRLILEDAAGCRQTFTNDSLFVETIALDFVLDKRVVCEGESVQISNFSNATTDIESIEWTFPGGTPSTSTDFDPSVTYNNAGVYDIKLKIISETCIDSLILSNAVAVDAFPNADFAANPTDGCEPLSVVFTDQSTISIGTISSWEWDFGDNTGSSTQNPTHAFSEGSYSTKLIVTSPNGACQDSTTVDVVALPTPVLVPGEEPTICLNDRAVLDMSISTDTTGVVYSWTPSTGLSCSDCLTPIASPSISTVYTLRATGPNTCFTETNISVNVIPQPIPEIELIDSIIVCEQGVIVLDAVVSNTQVLTYEWIDTTSTGLTLSCTDCSNPFASPDVNTTYILNVISLGGCVASDTILVEVINEFVEFAGPDRGLCIGDTIMLSAPFGDNPRWTPSTGLNCTFCPEPIASPVQTIDYVLTVDYRGCPMSDTIRVRVIQEDEIDAGRDTLVCIGEPVQLNGMGVGSLSWSPTTYLNNANISDPTMINPQESTTYTLRAEFENCIIEDEVFVNVVRSAEVVAEGDEICAGDTTQLFSEGIAHSYLWTPSAGLSDPTDPNPIVTGINETRTYTVTANIANCQSATAEATVLVNQAPTIKLLPIFRFILGQTVTLNVEIEEEGNYSYEWMPRTGLTCTDCPTPSVLPDTNTVYSVIVTNIETGCFSEASVELALQEGCTGDLIKVPNAFSPNGDGNNDILYVRGTALSQVEIFRIFNRWGELIFESKDIRNGWDGTQNGDPLNPGVYVYYVEAPCAVDGTKLFKKGNVTLIR